MSAPLGGSILLFVAGEPDTGAGSTRDVEASVFRRAGGFLMGGWAVDSPRQRAQLRAMREGANPQEPSWHLPRPQEQCAKLVVEIANELGRTVVLVDVNRPTGREDLIQKWVGPNHLLPVLVRPDGKWLEGQEHFVPRQVRRFLAQSRT